VVSFYHFCSALTLSPRELIILSIAVSMTGGNCLKADPTMQAVTKNVAASELLYENLDVAHELNYHTANKPSAKEPPSGVHTVESSVVRARSVTQRGMYRLDTTTTLNAPRQEPTTSRYTRAYDGKQTRVLDGPVANVHSSRLDPTGLFRPHTALLSRAAVHFPLSLWLIGGDQLSKHKLAGPYAKAVQSASLVGEETIDGLRCSHILCETSWSQGRAMTVRHLWLAQDRNYLPVKTVAYSHRLSKSVPVETGHSSDFREIAPGIWLPFRVKVEVADEPKLARDNLYVTGNSEELTLVHAKLDPALDQEYFERVEIPEGTYVYDVHDGKITTGRIEGEHNPKPKAFTTLRLILVITFFLLLSLAAFLWRRNRHSRRSAQP